MENTCFQNGRIVKRRIMEAQGGAEVRRLHILYFLSRNGRNEHPHLIRIHHLSKNGVRLKDIKRWLGELRGKDMPESFAWSFKRTYKNGYVWQDILDDDLLTPISDNEYVLKGSEISSIDNLDFSSMPKQKELKTAQESAQGGQRASSKEIEDDIHLSHSSSYVSSKTASSAQDSFGSETSTSTQDSVNDAVEKSPGNRFIQEEAALLSDKKKKRKTNKLEIINGKSIISRSKTADNKPNHRKSHSGAMFRNFISCGGVDTNDSVITMNSKRYKPFLKSCSSNSAEEVRASAKEKGAAAYRPLYGPKCSQCGKTFKPEKLQSHMNSCKGMKAFLAKGSNHATENRSKRSTASVNESSVSAYLLKIDRTFSLQCLFF